MDAAEFRQRGKEMVDYIADYIENIKERRVTPEIEPGYLKKIVPLVAPHEPQDWETIMKDVDEKIMPGITHWQHPDFHAYFPAGNSFSSILGDLLSTGLGINGFSWATSPACTELETIVMQWMGVMSGLSPSLLPYGNTSEVAETREHRTSESNNNELKVGDNESRPSAGNPKEDLTPNLSSNHCGGGVLLGSASECVLVSMLAARTRAISRYKRTFENVEDGIILTKLVAYTSQLAHSCVEKAAMICLVKIRMLDTDENYSLRGETVKKAMEDDMEKGLIPFYVCATFGTTSCCSYDNVVEIGPVCIDLDVYLHVDGAYAGNALICEEFRDLMRGVEYLDSLSYNPNKWMLMNYDCSCLWVKNKFTLTKALSIDPVYLRHNQMEKTIDYRNWGISLSRKFKALKLWFTIRKYGVKGLQSYIREHVRLAKEFEKLVLTDSRFKIVGKVTLGLVCFCLKGPEELSKNLLFMLNASGKIHMIPSLINDEYTIRFCVNAQNATIDDINTAWRVIKEYAQLAIDEYKSKFEVSELNSSNVESQLSLNVLRRNSFVRMVSEPVKHKSVGYIQSNPFKHDFLQLKLRIHRSEEVLSDQLECDLEDDIPINH